jgi:hypothetical protein
MPHPRLFYIALVLLLVLLNAGSYLLQDVPEAPSTAPLMISREILDYRGTDLPLTAAERAILAPAKTISRRYEREDRRVIWLNMLEAASIGTLHNFYDSLVASGSRPRILKTVAIETDKGPLRTTLIQYSNRHGQLFYLLLWYQWEGGNAENRWRWYEEILKLRLQRKKPYWRLIEIATLKTAEVEDPKKSPDLQNLKLFAKALYEAPNSPIPGE